VARLLIDDHLLRDVLTSRRPPDLGGLSPDGVATTSLWLFRLCSSWADPKVRRKLSSPVGGLPPSFQAAFRSRLVSLPDEIEVLSSRELAWSMAELSVRHRAYGRDLPVTMAEALAAAWRLRGGIAVCGADVDPNLKAAARADGIEFHTL